ncbi:molybdate ABC transporter substrate-binding protein [Virgibacillus oceani]
MKYLVILMVGLVSLTSCGNQSEDELFQPSTEESELFISAATSLSDVMNDITEAFEASHPYIHITVNFGGSGTLSQQIQQGAPVDVFLSADQIQMDFLEEQDLILPDMRTDFTGNRLVMIGEKDNGWEVDSMEELHSLEADNIAIANPDSVPAGNYTREALISSNVWEDLSDQFIFAKDVRQAMTYVESGNADIGFVYYTDALKSSNTEIIMEIDTSLHDTITYPAAVMTNSTSSREAEYFIEFLESHTAEEIFEAHGFANE